MHTILWRAFVLLPTVQRPDCPLTINEQKPPQSVPAVFYVSGKRSENNRRSYRTADGHNDNTLSTRTNANTQQHSRRLGLSLSKPVSVWFFECYQQWRLASRKTGEDMQRQKCKIIINALIFVNKSKCLYVLASALLIIL